MTEERDAFLEDQFSQVSQDLYSEDFTARVMRRTRRTRLQLLASGGGLVVILAICTWLLALPVQEFSLLVARTLAIALIDLGDGWVAWALSPVNNLAGLLVLIGKLLRMMWKRTIRASFAH